MTQGKFDDHILWDLVTVREKWFASFISGPANGSSWCVEENTRSKPTQQCWKPFLCYYSTHSIYNWAAHEPLCPWHPLPTPSPRLKTPSALPSNPEAGTKWNWKHMHQVIIWIPVELLIIDMVPSELFTLLQFHTIEENFPLSPSLSLSQIFQSVSDLVLDENCNRITTCNDLENSQAWHSPTRRTNSFDNEDCNFPVWRFYQASWFHALWTFFSMTDK